MFAEYRIYVAMVLSGAAILAVVFSFPALTTGGYSPGVPATEAQLDEVIAEERDFCERQPEDLDCQCFAGVSGVVLLNGNPRVPGATYADQQDLARSQAAQKC